VTSSYLGSCLEGEDMHSVMQNVSACVLQQAKLLRDCGNDKNNPFCCSGMEKT
jgi:hypothetical protein